MFDTLSLIYEKLPFDLFVSFDKSSFISVLNVIKRRFIRSIKREREREGENKKKCKFLLQFIAYFATPVVITFEREKYV